VGVSLGAVDPPCQGSGQVTFVEPFIDRSGEPFDDATAEVRGSTNQVPVLFSQSRVRAVNQLHTAQPLE